MLTFDYIICNPDRHLKNIEFIYSTNYFRFTPYLDHGRAFLGRDGGLTNSEIESLIRKFKTKPFSTKPEKNIIDIRIAKNITNNFINALNTNYGNIENLPIPDFHKKLIKIRIKQLLSL